MKLIKQTRSGHSTIIHGIMTRTISMMLMRITMLAATIIRGISIQITTIHMPMIHTSLKQHGTNIHGILMVQSKPMTRILGRIMNTQFMAPGCESSLETVKKLDGRKD